jgi:hypothetical protein
MGMNWGHLVRADGTLDEALVVRSEFLMEGAKAQRFTVQEGSTLQTYVFKPVETNQPILQERWIQSTFLPWLKEIRSPKLIADSLTYGAGHTTPWMIWEDVGPVQHRFDVEAKCMAAKNSVAWHQMPTDLLPSEQLRFLPMVDDVVSELIQKRDTFETSMVALNIEPEVISSFWEQVQSLSTPFMTEHVLCHGDYHPRNVAQVDGSFIVLDWEFIQRNSVFWDLYLLIDRAMPNYRIEPSASARLRILQTYVDERVRHGWTTPPDFFQQYHVFTALFTVHVLPLLINDLETGAHDMEGLHAEALEVKSIVEDCVQFIWANPPDPT